LPEAIRIKPKKRANRCLVKDQGKGNHTLLHGCVVLLHRWKAPQKSQKQKSGPLKKKHIARRDRKIGTVPAGHVLRTQRSPTPGKERGKEGVAFAPTHSNRGKFGVAKKRVSKTIWLAFITGRETRGRVQEAEGPWNLNRTPLPSQS